MQLANYVIGCFQQLIMEVKFNPKNINIRSQCIFHNCQATPIKFKLKNELEMKQNLEKCNQMKNDNSNI